MRVFMLEDDQRRVDYLANKVFGEEVTHTDSVSAAAEILRENEFELIMLDHDLTRDSQMVVDDAVESGRDLAKLMSLEKLSVDTPIIVHSLNEEGANLICDILEDTHSKVHRVDYFTLKFKYGLDGIQALLGDRKWESS